MKRVLWGVLILLSILFSSYKLFETSVGEQGCYYEGISTIPSANGGWLVSGAYNCDGNPTAWKSCLVTLDTHGDTVSLLKDLPYNGIMRLTPDGNLIFAGGNHAGFVYDTAKIFKVTLSGELLWKKNLFENYCQHLLTDILPIPDGFLVVGNYAQSSCTSPVYDSYIAKLDNFGELLWKYDVTGVGNEQLHVVKLTKDNNIAAFGWTENKSSADDADYLLIKLDSSGNKIWSQAFGDEQDNYGYGMDVTHDNGFILNGHSSTMDAMRLDANGNLVWSKFLTETCGGRYFKAYASLDGGFVFLGMEKSSSQQCTSVLVKTNSTGDIFWKKNFEGVIREVEESNSGHFTLTGYKSYLPKLYVVGFDTTALKREENLEEVEFLGTNENQIFSNEQNILETTNEELINGNIKTHITYPNPSVDIVNIEFENGQHKTYQLEIYDSNGKMIMKSISDSERIVVTGKHLAKGIYTYKLNGNGNVFYGKILFQ